MLGPLQVWQYFPRCSCRRKVLRERGKSKKKGQGTRRLRARSVGPEGTEVQSRLMAER